MSNLTPAALSLAPHKHFNMNWWQRFLHRPFFIKLLHWEYWSMNTVYALVYPVFAWLCFRSGFKFFITASNPRIKNGGFLLESKKEIYDLLPPLLHPKTLLFSGGTPATQVIQSIKENKLSFPLMAKPDIGMRGLAAKKLENESDVLKFIPCFTINFLVQEFVSFENELGIFYYRYPGESKGHISGIVAKEFLAVYGDGQSTLLQLLQRDKRFVLQIPSLQKEYGAGMNEVIKAGEKMLLVPYGNHARGAKFLDYSHLIDAELTQTIDDICQQVPDFFYGRIDLRYNTWEELRQGRNISIIELNGAGSEPTHIYDPKHSLFFAWKEIIRHWILLYRISKINHRKGHPYMSVADGFAMFRENNLYLEILLQVHDRLLHAEQ
ncbi:MAG: D-alanine--D-alanine ligase [Sphingobacteriales bacterium]|nr:D-alanine--D-alanine ligase [Sphingobacteriales bacterium]